MLKLCMFLNICERQKMTIQLFKTFVVQPTQNDLTKGKLSAWIHKEFKKAANKKLLLHYSLINYLYVS